MHPQNPPSHLLPLLLILSSFMISCLGYYPQNKNPIVNILDQTHGYDSKAYHPYFTSIDRQDDSNYKPSFPSSLLNYKARSRTRLSKANAHSSSPKIVNVDDFGAKGDGRTDDSEV